MNRWLSRSSSSCSQPGPPTATWTAFARRLVHERLAACVNVLAPMTSIYRWQGNVEQATERQVLIKTTRASLGALRARVHELHPYDVPGVPRVVRADGSDTYSALDPPNPFTPEAPEDQDLSDCLSQVVDQILRILDPGRDPDETVGQTDRGAPLGRHRRMRHRRRM